MSDEKNSGNGCGRCYYNGLPVVTEKVLHEIRLLLMQEILDCLKNRNEVAAETQDASVNALEVAQEDFEGAVDVADLPDNSQEQETLDKAGDAEN